MNKRKRWRIFFSIITAVFLLLALANTADQLFFHPPFGVGFFWGWDPKTDQIYFKEVIKGEPLSDAGILVGDTLRAIDNQSFTSIKNAWNHLNTFKPGDRVTYTIKRGDQILNKTFTLKSSNKFVSFTVISALVGILFLIVGFIAAYKKPYMRTPRLFYYFCFTFFLLFGLNSITHFQPLNGIVMTAHIAGIFFWAPSVLHFFMNFPVKAPILHKYPRFIFFIYVPSIIISTYFFFINQKLAILFNVVIFIYFALAFFQLARSKTKITNPHEKKSLNLIYWGMLFGLLPLGILSFMADWVVATFGFTPIVIIFGLTILVPIAFGYSIMRYGLMDVEIIIKKSLVYTILTTSIVLFYFLIVIGLGGFLFRKFGISSEPANLVFLGLVALAFQPVRNGIQQVIDRRFYRRRYEYQKTLLKLSQELPGLVNIQDILKRVAETISVAMKVSTVIIDLYDQKTQQYQNQYSIGVNMRKDFGWKSQPHGLVDIIEKEKNCCLFYKIEEDDRYNNLPVSDKVKIEKLGIVLSIPMFYHNALIGMISLGLKQSGQVYNQEDMDLLQTLAGNTAIALVNGRLHQEDLHKQRLENELLLARHIQIRLLPKHDPVLPNLEIVGVSQPATIVGGDYYDYIPIAENRLFVFVGDVSGKGMPAALYMSKVQGMIQIAAGIHKSPLKLLSEMNRHLYRGMERKFFVTMLGALIDVPQKKITLCRAGHMPVYIKRKDKMEKISGTGIGLGLEAGEIFDRQLEEKHVRLKPGDFCLFFSDGLVEMLNPDREMFGEERLEHFIANGDFSSAAELKEKLLAEIQAFQNGVAQNDDITFVVMRASRQG